jgi:hypothetical protein
MPGSSGSKAIGAGKDARSVSTELTKQGYSVLAVNDASRSEMVRAFNELILGTKTNESVMVYYAGHGHIHPGSSQGFWLPADASVDDPRGWVSNTDIAKFLTNIPAKQVLLVADSCFSGSLTREEEASSTEALTRDAILTRRAVAVMSSGGEEVVSDSGMDGHSPFTFELLHQLRSGNQYKPALTVLKEIQANVAPHFNQTPQYGTLVSAGHVRGGDYLLNPARE